jgi:[ribosomal protein S5]-alanine N-acetyltransferase
VHLKQPVISTPRLELHHISADRLIDLYEKRDDTFALSGEPFTNPLRNLIDFQGPLAWRVPQVKADPSTNKWFVRWIVIKENREVIGSTSFHGAPDAQGMMEIGLGIETQYQNQGYAKEALLGMWRWVLTFPEVKTLRYTVSPENLPSIAVIKYFGFDFKGQQIDEEDAPEDIFEMDCETFLNKWGAS